jgi:hypothetical protein
MKEQPEVKQVPLVELLAAVPADIRIGVDDGNDWKAGTTWHPVGLLCHEAAAELRRLDWDNRELRRCAEVQEVEKYASANRRFAKINAQLLEALAAASNYIDTLGGASQNYRAAIAAAKGEA